MSDRFSRGHQRRRWASVFALLSAVVLLAPAGTAVARDTDNIFPQNLLDVCVEGGDNPDAGGLCLTDNNDVTVFIESSISLVGVGIIRQALTDFNDHTDLNVTYAAAPVYTGASETDIIYRQGTTGMGVDGVGVTWCNAAAADVDRCDQAYTQYVSSRPSTPQACHETGHAVGLLHGANAKPVLDNEDTRLGCMVATESTFQRVLGYNNVDNINDSY